jgi:hypothetical protein
VKLRCRIEGLAVLQGRFSAIAAEDAFAPDLHEAAEDIRARAAAGLTDGAAPESRSGALAQSLVVERGDRGGYAVSTPLDHGWHLEFGSAARPASPWLAPALEAGKPGLLARIRERLSHTVAAARNLR